MDTLEVNLEEKKVNELEVITSARKYVAFNLIDSSLFRVQVSAIKDLLKCTNNNLDSIVELATQNMCVYATSLIIDYIRITSPNLFEEVYRLNGFSPFKNTSWIYHTYVALKGYSGQFYALSPANYKVQGYNPLELVIVGSSLLDLKREIAFRDGGDWNTEDTPLKLNGNWIGYSAPDLDVFLARKSTSVNPIELNTEETYRKAAILKLIKHFED